MAAQLFQAAPHHDAKVYYSTMVQDESRHTEAWLKLIELAGGTAERDGQKLKDDPVIRQRIAQLVTDGEVARVMGLTAP